MSSERPSDDPSTRRAALRALVGAFGAAATLVAASYGPPQLARLRPWEPGEPLPVVRVLAPATAPRVVEDERGELVAAPEEAPRAPIETADASPAAVSSPASLAAPAGRVDAATMPARPPGVATPLVDDEHRGMDRFYRALARVEAGEGLARAAHWGDSTIAADGITGTVRARLQARFGDGGPGYLSAGMDPRWNIRKDVTNARVGEWETHSLLVGGATTPRYGFGGIVSRAAADASLTFNAPKVGGERVRQKRVEVWWQAAPDSGSAWVALDGRGVWSGPATSEDAGDRWFTLDVNQGYTRVGIGASAGAVTFYGVVMETAGPGVVWDALGVVGVGSRSFTRSSRKHVASQVARRAPDLVVVQLGGNELGLPVLSKGDGSEYGPYFRDALDRLRAGAPEAACVVVTPIDQATRSGGTPETKPNLPRMVAQQRVAAAAAGCAFWDATAAMGGSGSIVRWSRLKPPLAWADLLHLSADGQALVGDLLADAILAGYDAWKASGGPARAPVVAAESP